MPETSKGRITVVESVYYSDQEHDPIGVESRFSRAVSNEQVYIRHCVATEEWQKLDCGWLSENVGMLCIKNEGTTRQTNPTDEERAEDDKKVLKIGYTQEPDDEPNGFWLVPPGESFRGYPQWPSDLRIKCQSGEVKFIVSVYPG